MVQVVTNAERSIELRRTYNASPDRVYRAWTDPALVERWLAPRPYRCQEVALDVRVGGHYRIVMVNPENGNTPVIGGVYEVVEPGKKLAFTWRWETWRDDSRVTVEFLPTDTGTEVRLRHEQLPSDSEREGHVTGWTACLDQNEEVL